MSLRGHKAVPGVVPQDSGIGHSAANLGSELAQGTSLGQRNTSIGMQHVEAVIKYLDQLSFEEEPQNFQSMHGNKLNQSHNSMVLPFIRRPSSTPSSSWEIVRPTSGFTGSPRNEP
jgi:hypothetical protein